MTALGLALGMDCESVPWFSTSASSWLALQFRLSLSCVPPAIFHVIVVSRNRALVPDYSMSGIGYLDIEKRPSPSGMKILA